MQYEIFPVIFNGTKQWRWRLRAANGKILASGESFQNRQDCEYSVGMLMDTNRQTKFQEVLS